MGERPRTVVPGRAKLAAASTQSWPGCVQGVQVPGAVRSMCWSSVEAVGGAELLGLPGGGGLIPPERVMAVEWTS